MAQRRGRNSSDSVSGRGICSILDSMTFDNFAALAVWTLALPFLATRRSQPHGSGLFGVSCFFARVHASHPAFSWQCAAAHLSKSLLLICFVFLLSF